MSDRAPSATGFTGWLRLTGAPWQPVVQDVDEGECQARLLRHADTVPGTHKDLTPSCRRAATRTAGRCGGRGSRAISCRS